MEFAGAKSTLLETGPHEFDNFCQKVTENAPKFADYVAQLDDEKIYFDSMPMKLDSKLTPFEKLLVVKLFKPQKLMGAVQKYIKAELGQYYSLSPISTLEQLFAAADNVTPIIFVLSQGVDSSQ
jgi:hypothetical protein